LNIISGADFTVMPSFWKRIDQDECPQYVRGGQYRTVYFSTRYALNIRQIEGERRGQKSREAIECEDEYRIQRSGLSKHGDGESSPLQDKKRCEITK
jgi:hypothetical protein